MRFSKSLIVMVAATMGASAAPFAADQSASAMATAMATEAVAAAATATGALPLPPSEPPASPRPSPFRASLPGPASPALLLPCPLPVFLLWAPTTTRRRLL
ncbi:hypothetical protein CMUS01_12956, partial [Colletotrichum musicola]